MSDAMRPYHRDRAMHHIKMLMQLGAVDELVFIQGEISRAFEVSADNLPAMRPDKPKLYPPLSVIKGGLDDD